MRRPRASRVLLILGLPLTGAGLLFASQGAYRYLARFSWGCPGGETVCVDAMKDRAETAAFLLTFGYGLLLGGVLLLGAAWLLEKRRRRRGALARGGPEAPP